MIHYPEYRDVPEAALGEFVRSCELGRLVTASPEGEPHVGIYPFLYVGDAIELHLHRDDEQLADLAANPRCLFTLDEPLAVVPSHWLHAESAVFATAYYRIVSFVCRASIDFDPATLVAQQTRLLAHHQREGGFRPLDPEHPLYRAALGKIAALRLEIGARKVKWKLGQNRTPEQRRAVAARLRERGRPSDGRAADALEATLAT